MRTPSSKLGFSLVELSIVLVILGLLTGGILAGQSLIRAAELRAVSTESQRYATAISSFRDKYFAVPGDMSNATSFGTTTWIGNGDGDGQVELSTTTASNEVSTFWIHLAAAGLIEGAYTNVAGTSTSISATMTAGTHVPRSKMTAAGWGAIYLGTPAASSLIYYPVSYGNAFIFGPSAGTIASGTGSVTPTTSGVLKSEEAWNIDTKMDDQRPDTGSFTALEAQGNATPGSGCGNLAASTTALAASSYDLQNTSGTACTFIIKTGY